RTAADDHIVVHASPLPCRPRGDAGVAAPRHASVRGARMLAARHGIGYLARLAACNGRRPAPRRMTHATHDPNRRRGLRQVLEQLGVDSPALWWSLLYFFCLLTGYYVMRPVRDAMGASGDVAAVFPPAAVAWAQGLGIELREFTLQVLFT